MWTIVADEFDDNDDTDGAIGAIVLVASHAILLLSLFEFEAIVCMYCGSIRFECVALVGDDINDDSDNRKNVSSFMGLSQSRFNSLLSFIFSFFLFVFMLFLSLLLLISFVSFVSVIWTLNNDNNTNLIIYLRNNRNKKISPATTTTYDNTIVRLNLSKGDGKTTKTAVLLVCTELFWTNWIFHLLSFWLYGFMLSFFISIIFYFTFIVCNASNAFESFLRIRLNFEEDRHGAHYMHTFCIISFAFQVYINSITLLYHYEHWTSGIIYMDYSAIFQTKHISFLSFGSFDRGRRNYCWNLTSYKSFNRSDI